MIFTFVPIEKSVIHCSFLVPSNLQDIIRTLLILYTLSEMTLTNTVCSIPKCQITCTFHCLLCWKGSVQVRDYIPFCNMLSFYSDELLALHPPLKLQDNPLSAVYSQLPSVSGGCLLHPQPEDTPSVVMGPLIMVCNMAVSTKSRTVKLLLDVRQTVLQLRYKNRPFPAATYHSSCKTFNSLYTQMSSFL